MTLCAGKELAEQSEILETVGDQDPAEFYYGQVLDRDGDLPSFNVIYSPASLVLLLTCIYCY